MSANISQDVLNILESEDFNSLLDAVELMAKAQGNLMLLQQSVDELKNMMNDDISSDTLSIADNAAILGVVDDVENLVSDLKENRTVSGL